MASRKISLLIFRAVQRFFAVRFAHSMASFAGLPGSGGLRYPSNCGKVLAIQVKQYPPLPGPGRGCPPWWGLGQSPNGTSPRQISVFRHLALFVDSKKAAALRSRSSPYIFFCLPSASAASTFCDDNFLSNSGDIADLFPGICIEDECTDGDGNGDGLSIFSV